MLGQPVINVDQSLGTRIMAFDVNGFEDRSTLMVPNWARLGYWGQGRPLGGHKGTSLGAHEPGPHSFTVP